MEFIYFFGYSEDNDEWPIYDPKEFVKPRGICMENLGLPELACREYDDEIRD